MNEQDDETTLWQRWYLILEGLTPGANPRDTFGFTQAVLILCKPDVYSENQRAIVWRECFENLHERYRDFQYGGNEWWRGL